MTCAIIGDSIAIGLALVMQAHGHFCDVAAQVGVSSKTVIEEVHDADVVVVSAGSNDPRNPKLFDNLVTIRSKIHGSVIWIQPVNKRAADAVWKVADQYGDSLLAFPPGKDNVHPKSYEDLAELVEGAIE